MTPPTLRAGLPLLGRPALLSRVVGRHCESGDIVVGDAWLPSDLAPGDLLAVPATGAYCRSRPATTTTCRARPWSRWERADARVIVRRETLTRTCWPWTADERPTSRFLTFYKVALLGCGVVGSEVARLLTEHAGELAARTAPGSSWPGSRCAGWAPARAPRSTPELLTTDAAALVRRPTWTSWSR